MTMRPTRADILNVVLAAPHGLTSAELAVRLGCSPYHVSTIVSKLASYGEIAKELIPGNRQSFRWKRKSAALAAAE
jgi:DNA-binding transcriptional regulator GbsR (MarR family)